jgi:FKBP-type peptidyl-prolyl cis-trans isomerase
MRLLAGLAGALALAAAAPALAAEAAPAPMPSAAEFMMTTSKQPGVVSGPSGLLYKVVKSGPAGGVSPKPGDAIKVHYEGALANGEVFDSSIERGKPALMMLDRLVPGWMLGLPLMKPGDEWVLYLPPELGYGARGAGPIPPGSALVFKLQLLGVLSAD